MKGTVGATVVLLALTASAAAQDIAAGERVFRKCRACHEVGENAKIRVGPPLNGLDGREAGTVEGYNYTKANKNSGIVWNEETFAEYIANPRGVIPGTKMLFPGLKKEKEIADVWAYLQQFGPDGKKKP